MLVSYGFGGRVSAAPRTGPNRAGFVVGDSERLDSICSRDGGCLDSICSRDGGLLDTICSRDRGHRVLLLHHDGHRVLLLHRWRIEAVAVSESEGVKRPRE
jgi:hypothetical protein